MCVCMCVLEHAHMDSVDIEPTVLVDSHENILKNYNWKLLKEIALDDDHGLQTTSESPSSLSNFLFV